MRRNRRQFYRRGAAHQRQQSEEQPPMARPGAWTYEVPTRMNDSQSAGGNDRPNEQSPARGHRTLIPPSDEGALGGPPLPTNRIPWTLLPTGVALGRAKRELSRTK